jgi:hypothetical protein
MFETLKTMRRIIIAINLSFIITGRLYTRQIIRSGVELNYLGKGKVR